MRVKLSPMINMSAKQKKMLNDYINERAMQLYDEQSVGLIRRCYKTFAVALHKKYGFGHARLMDLMEELGSISKLRDKDEAFWKHVDTVVIDEIKLEFEREKYDEMDD